MPDEDDRRADHQDGESHLIQHTDVDGVLLYEVLRYEPKDFLSKTTSS